MTTTGLAFDEFEPKTATREDWAAFHAYSHARHAELRPEDPMWPDDLQEKEMLRDDPFNFIRRFVLKDGDEVIGRFFSYSPKPENPEYETNKHLIYLSGSLLKDRRRQGLGTKYFLPKALELAEQYNASVITAGTEEDEGRNFLTKIGAEKKLDGAENRLKWEEIDWDMITSWIAEAKERSADTRLELYEPRLPRELWDSYIPIYSDLMNQQPFDDLDHGDIIITPEKFEEWYERAEIDKSEHMVMITREPDGTISGLTETWWSPAQPGYVGQALTGVLPEHRGRGLGKWLKAEMLDHLKSKYSDLVWVVTGNANSNDPMLSINKRLGFKTYKGGESYQVSVDKVRAFLG